MNTGPREELARLVVSEGDALLHDARLVRALLQDAHPEERREVAVLVAAAEEGVPLRLQRSADEMSRDGQIGILAKDLSDARGLQPEIARWAVDSWAWALLDEPVAAPSAGRGPWTGWDPAGPLMTNLSPTADAGPRAQGFAGRPVADGPGGDRPAAWPTPVPPPPREQKRPSRARWLIPLAIAAVLLIGALAVISASTEDPTPGPTISGGADSYGDDAELDLLWDECEATGASACDDLYLESPLGSVYEDFGATCGYRASDWSSSLTCAETF